MGVGDVVEVGLGLGVGDVVEVGVGVGDGVGEGFCDGVGEGVGDGVGEGVGDGVDAGATSCGGCVAWWLGTSISATAPTTTPSTVTRPPNAAPRTSAWRR